MPCFSWEARFNHHAFLFHLQPCANLAVFGNDDFPLAPGYDGVIRVSTDKCSFQAVTIKSFRWHGNVQKEENCVRLN